MGCFPFFPFLLCPLSIPLYKILYRLPFSVNVLLGKLKRKEKSTNKVSRLFFPFLLQGKLENMFVVNASGSCNVTFLHTFVYLIFVVLEPGAGFIQIIVEPDLCVTRVLQFSYRQGFK